MLLSIFFIATIAAFLILPLLLPLYSSKKGKGNYYILFILLLLILLLLLLLAIMVIIFIKNIVVGGKMDLSKETFYCNCMVKRIKYFTIEG